jgi:hypothetical protein
MRHLGSGRVIQVNSRQSPKALPMTSQSSIFAEEREDDIKLLQESEYEQKVASENAMKLEFVELPVFELLCRHDNST